MCCYTTLLNVTEWDKRSQRFIDHAIARWRRRLECVVQQQCGHIEHWMWKVQDVTVTATNLRCGGIFSDSFITNFFWFWQWNNFVNWLIFDKVNTHKQIVPIFGPPCIYDSGRLWHARSKDTDLSYHLPISTLCTVCTTQSQSTNVTDRRTDRQTDGRHVRSIRATYRIKINK